MRSHSALMTLRLLWFALLAATFMYLGMAVGVFAKTAAKPQLPIMPYVLGGLSLMIAIISFVLPAILYARVAKMGEVGITDEAAPNAFPARYREAMPKRQIFSDPQAAMNKAFSSFMVPFILSLALSEAIALFGLVLVVLGFGVPMALPFFLLGALLIGIRFPTQAKVLGMFEKVRLAAFPTTNG